MPARKKVTLEAVAREAGVSVSTASMVLSARTDVSFSRETVDRVRGVAARLGYTPSRSHGRSPLAGGRTVLVLCPNVTNAYYAVLVQSVQKAAAAHGADCLVCPTYRSPEQEERMLRLAGPMGFCGVIFTMMPQCVELAETLNTRMPVVAVGDRTAGLGMDTVELDNFRAGCLVGTHLLELGHRRVAFLSTTLNTANSVRLRRLAGVREAFEGVEGARVTVLSRDITPEEELGELDVEYATGRDLALRCLARWKDVTALVAINDSVAYGVLDALAERGVDVPGGCSVCGFDNLAFSRLSPIRLTSVDHHIAEKGSNAVAMLFRRFRDEGAEGNVTRIEFNPRLIRGVTTGPAPATAAGDAEAGDGSPA